MTESTVESSTEAVLNVARTERIRVLHVDDDQAFLKVAKQCLEMQGEIDVDTVSSVNEASEKLKKTDYDAVVCDYQMPDKDGLEFLKELRANGNTVPFIVFTGKGREEVAIKALNLGADRYVDKHGDPETVYCELAHAIRQATDRKSKEIELFKKEAELQAVLESSPDAITVSDLNGNVIQCNKATLDMLGFSSKDELIGKNGYELIAEKDRQKATENLKKTLDQGSVRNIEYAFLTRDGHEFPTELSASVLRDSSGKVVGFVSVAKNISKRKKAEEELRIQREELQVILDSMPAKIWYKDRNNRLVRVNKAFAEYMGVSKENLEGKPLFDLFPPDIAQKCWEEDKEVFTTGQPKTDILDRHESAQGVRWFSTGKVPCREKDGNIIGTINFSVDVTERKQAEEAMRQSEVRYRELTDSIGDVFFAMDKNFRYTYWNKASEKLTGISAKDAIGKSLTEVFPDVKGTKMEQVYLKTLRTQQPQSYLNKYQLEGKDYVFEINAYPTETGLSAFVKDVTERKREEHALLESQQKFERLFEGIPEATASVDANDCVLDLNPRFSQLFGYSVDEAKGKPLDDLIVPNDKKKEAKMLTENSQEGYVLFETVRKTKDGSLVHVSISAAPVIIEDKQLGYVGVYKDITNLKDAEERLREMNKRLEVTNEKLHVVGGLTRHDVRNKLVAVTGNAYLLRQKLVGDAKALGQLNDMEAAVRLVEEIFEFARIYEKLGVEQLTSMDVGKAVEGAVSLFSGLKGVKMVNECRGLTVLADSLLSQLFYNLIDNSLKYGEKTRQIKVYCKTSSSNQLELVYEDDGVGIPDNMRSNLFKEGFTSGKGTGYGLFMIKRICEVYGWTIQEKGTQGKGARFIMTIPDQRAH